MHLFFSGNKQDMIILRDTLNELLEDPQLDRKEARITMEDKGVFVKIDRETKVDFKEET